MTHKIDKLSLIAGIDLPIPELGVSIHQPTIKDIAHIGESKFFSSAQIITKDVEDFLLDSSESLSEEDKVVISKMSNFQLIMTMSAQEPKVKLDVMLLLTLLFPSFMIEVEERFIMLVDSSGDKPRTIMIDDNNFSVLQDVVKIILCLNSSTQKEGFNPQGELAREIAEKIKKGRAKVAASKGETQKESTFLSKYISALGIATQSLNILQALDLTLYQLFDQIERFSLHEAYKISLQARLAGAKDVEDVDWLKDIER